MAKLTDRQKKQIVADYIACQNYSEVGRKYGVSKTTVRNVVEADSQTSEKLRQKANENMQDTLTYMAEQHETKKRIINKILTAMEQKAENVDMFTNIKDLATAYGILIDKELKFAEIEQAKRAVNEPIEIILRRDDAKDKD